MESRHDGNMKPADKANTLNTRVESTKLCLNETDESEVCTGVICKKLYELVHFLQSYNVHTYDF